MQRETVGHTFLVALALCGVCSLLVSTAAVGLRPLQQANKELMKRRNILSVSGLLRDDASIDEVFKSIDVQLIDLATGTEVDAAIVDPGSYDEQKAAKDPNLSVPTEGDLLPGIKRRAKYYSVYLVKNSDADGYDQVILPVFGKGLWSTLLGFISVDADGQTVRGLTFYEHGETPGLGGEVDNPLWKSKWSGKSIYSAGDAGDKLDVRIEVIKGPVSADDPNKRFKVDGLSGATITSRGVSQMLRYWMGDDGFGPFLQRFRVRNAQGG